MKINFSSFQSRDQARLSGLNFRDAALPGRQTHRSDSNSKRNVSELQLAIDPEPSGFCAGPRSKKLNIVSS